MEEKGTDYLYREQARSHRGFVVSLLISIHTFKNFSAEKSCRDRSNSTHPIKTLQKDKTFSEIYIAR
ncbi:hypothetical protein ACYZT8_20525 [Pseudomonas sp. LB3P93]